MANTQQIKMLLAKSAAAGVPAKWEDFADMQNGDIDVKKAELMAATASAPQQAPSKQEAAGQRFNEARFGMCCKLVTKEVGLTFAMTDRFQFASKVLSLFRSVCAADEMVRSAPYPQWDKGRYVASATETLKVDLPEAR